MENLSAGWKRAGAGICVGERPYQLLADTFERKRTRNLCSSGPGPGMAGRGGRGADEDWGCLLVRLMDGFLPEARRIPFLKSLRQGLAGDGGPNTPAGWKLIQVIRWNSSEPGGNSRKSRTAGAPAGVAGSGRQSLLTGGQEGYPPVWRSDWRR